MTNRNTIPSSSVSNGHFDMCVLAVGDANSSEPSSLCPPATYFVMVHADNPHLTAKIKLSTHVSQCFTKRYAGVDVLIIHSRREVVSSLCLPLCVQICWEIPWCKSPSSSSIWYWEGTMLLLELIWDLISVGPFNICVWCSGYGLLQLPPVVGAGSWLNSIELNEGDRNKIEYSTNARVYICWERNVIHEQSYQSITVLQL